jgi:serine kinase of HPr protein (carbohydrate metabolism regulator)
VLGILAEHEKTGNPITMEQIRKAVTDLYGDWNSLSDPSQTFIRNVMMRGQFEKMYEQVAQGEKETKKLMIRFEKDYPDVMKSSNVNGIVMALQKKADKASIIAQLRTRKHEGEL